MLVPGEIGRKIYAYKLSLYGRKKTDIAKELDVSVRTIYRWLEEIAFEEEMAGKDDSAIARQCLSNMVPKALEVYDDTLTNDHLQREKIDVATKVLQTHNIVGKDANVITNVVVDTAERSKRLESGLSKFGIKINKNRFEEEEIDGEYIDLSKCDEDGFVIEEDEED